MQTLGDNTPAIQPLPRRRFLPPHARKRCWVLALPIAVLVLCWIDVYRTGRSDNDLRDIATLTISAMIVTCIYVFAGTLLVRVIAIHAAIAIPLFISIVLYESDGIGLQSEMTAYAIAFTFQTPIGPYEYKIPLLGMQTELYRSFVGSWLALGYWPILWICILLGELGAWFVQSQRRGAGVNNAA